MAAGGIFENGRNPSLDLHLGRIEGLAVIQPGQGGAIGAQQKRRLDQIAPGLLDGEGRQVWVIQTAFRHDAIDRQLQLLLDLPQR